MVPPDDATRYEVARDATLAFLERKEFTAFAVFLIPFVLGFGGLWFFLLIGLHTLGVCSIRVAPGPLRPRRPARPANSAPAAGRPVLSSSAPWRPSSRRAKPLTAHHSPLTAPSLWLAQEEQAHFWQNNSIQVLTVCMAYAAVVSLPYRAANAVHLCSSHRSSTV